MSPVNIFLIISLAVAIAIPLALLIDRVRSELRVNKMLKPVREIVPNIEIADGFKLHERPQKVTALKRRSIPKEAA